MRSNYTVTNVSTRTLFSGTGSTDWLGRPSLCDLGTGVWAMTYRVAAQHANNGDGVVHIRFSTDEGANWSAEDTFTNGSAVTGAPFTPTAAWDASDSIIFLAPNGNLLLHILEQSNTSMLGTRQRRSTNGGATWTDEGIINSDATILGAQDFKLVGSDIYITTWSDPNTNQTTPFQTQLYKSTNSGTSWSKVSDITSTTDNTDEAGLAYLGGSTFYTVIRDSPKTKTWARTSTDLGLNWGSLVDITATTPAFGIMHRPRFRQFAETLLLYGRNYIDSTHEQIEVFVSTDRGASWAGPFLLDATVYADCGYGDVLQRANGQYYMANYAGTTATASIVEYIFTVTQRAMATPFAALAATGSGGRAPAIPPVAANLVLFLDGADIGVPVGSAITTWRDQSGNGLHGTQATSGRRPIRAALGATFDGTDDGIDVAYNALFDFGGGAWTLYIAANQSANKSTGIYVARNFHATQGTWYMRDNNGSGALRWLTQASGSSVTQDTASQIVIGTAMTIATVNGPSGQTVYKNGSSIASSASPSINVDSAVGLTIGNNVLYTTAAWPGTIHAVLLYRGGHSLAAVSAMTTWIRARYGI